MNTSKAIAKNTGAILLGDGVTLSLDFIVGVSLARYLGVAGYGVYSFVIGYLFFFRVLITLGINKILIREISRDNTLTAKTIGNMLITRTILSLFAIFLSILVINLLKYPNDTKILVYIISFTLLFRAAELTITSAFSASLKMKYYVIGRITGKILLVILVLTIILFKGTLAYVFISLLISSFLSFSMTLIFYKRFFPLKLNLDFLHSKKILKESIIIVPAIFFQAIYFRTDIILLSLMKTTTEVGYYSAAFKLIEILNVFPMALMTSMFPLFSKYFFDSKDLFEKSFEQSLRLMLLLGLPIAVGTTIFSENIISIIFGNIFLPSSGALSILIWAELFIFINIVFVNLLISMRRHSVMVFVAGVMALSNVILNYILIPNYSYYGASFATVFTQAVGAAIYFYLIKSIIAGAGPFNIGLLKIVAANILFYLFLEVFDFLPFYFIVLISIIAYFYIIRLLDCVTNEETAALIDIAKSVLRKRGI
ncbi:MAG: flippase [Candidatus Hodarchaeales archaeon]|jgi:O-antigen/teichoic acid export membrane protein